MIYKFEINGKAYTTKEIKGFSEVRKLESLGVRLLKSPDEPMNIASFLSGFLAFFGNMSLSQADKELEEHLISGKSIERLVELSGKALDESVFFQKLVQNQKNQEDQE